MKRGVKSHASLVIVDLLFTTGCEFFKSNRKVVILWSWIQAKKKNLGFQREKELDVHEDRVGVDVAGCYIWRAGGLLFVI